MLREKKNLYYLTDFISLVAFRQQYVVEENFNMYGFNIKDIILLLYLFFIIFIKVINCQTFKNKYQKTSGYQKYLSYNNTMNATKSTAIIVTSL